MQASVLASPSIDQVSGSVPASVSPSSPASLVTMSSPMNATETALRSLVDDQLHVRSLASLPKFLAVFQRARTEADQALVLIVLRATATASDTKLVRQCTAGFEQCGGLKLAAKWLQDAVDWGYTDLLVLLLDTLQQLPVQLHSITEARINEPVVKLRKTAPEDRVRKAAQELLKHWRARFTEKDKKDKAKAKIESSSNNNINASAGASSGANIVKDSAKPLKKRPIKRIERTTASNKSSELIGNLLQRKSAKEAAAKANSPSQSHSPSQSDSPNKSIENGKGERKGSPVPSASNSPKTPDDSSMAVQLPTIESFKVVANTVSKKIRWADEDGKDLVRVKLIESWRDQVVHHGASDESFRDAKMREHANERNMMQSHKDREAFHVVVQHEYSTPALLALPESLSSRRQPITTDEVNAQTQRARHEMEFLVLDGEVPPVSPKEWSRANEPHRGPPLEIPLSDVAGEAEAVPAEPVMSEQERELRDALGPLQPSTLAALMENEFVLPQVYEEAQRYGRRIPDEVVLAIIDQRRRGPMLPPQHMGPPPSRYGGPPPMPMSMPMGGNGFPPAFPPRGMMPNEYGRPYPPPPHGMKRKAPNGAGGILSDAPPPNKRMMKRGPVNPGPPPPCMYFNSPAGCKMGNGCPYSHDMGVLGNPEYNHGYGNPNGGGAPFGAPMPMRGGMRARR